MATESHAPKENRVPLLPIALQVEASPGEPIPIPDLGNAGTCNQCSVRDRHALHPTQLHLNLLPSWFGVLFGKHSSKKQKRTFTQHPLSRKRNCPPLNWTHKHRGAPLAIIALTVRHLQCAICPSHLCPRLHVLDCFSCCRDEVLTKFDLGKRGFIGLISVVWLPDHLWKPRQEHDSRNCSRSHVC